MDRKQRRKLILVAALFLVVALGGYVIGEKLERDAYEPPKAEGFNELDMFDHIEYNGRTYLRKTNLTSLLIIGVDRDSDQEPLTYRSGGQSDFLMLLVIDHNAKQIRQLQIDRDTITDVVMVSIMGKRVGTRPLQICLSHGFGRNDEERCEYTVEAVQNLLQGEKPELYLSVNLDAIDQFNDLLGGVTVTIEDDFTAFDPTMIPGTTMTLHGHQAEVFVRTRMYLGDGTNVSRMRRQSAYMTAATAAMRERLREDSGFAEKLYDALTDGMTTNMSRGRLINELNQACRYEVLPVERLDGTHTYGDDGFVEFHAEEKSILDWLLSAFYKEPLQ